MLHLVLFALRLSNQLKEMILIVCRLIVITYSTFQS